MTVTTKYILKFKNAGYLHCMTLHDFDADGQIIAIGDKWITTNRKFTATRFDSAEAAIEALYLYANRKFADDAVVFQEFKIIEIKYLHSVNSSDC